MVRKKGSLIDIELATRNREAYERRIREAGPHMRQLRILFGLSQAEFATITGLSPGLVNKIEMGRRPLTMATVFSLCLAFHISIEQFLFHWHPEEIRAEAAKRVALMRPDTIPYQMAQTDDRQRRLAIKHVRLEFGETIPAGVTDDLLHMWYWLILSGKATADEFVTWCKGWKPSSSTLATSMKTRGKKH